MAVEVPDGLPSERSGFVSETMAVYLLAVSVESRWCIYGMLIVAY